MFGLWIEGIKNTSYYYLVVNLRIDLTDTLIHSRQVILTARKENLENAWISSLKTNFMFDKKGSAEDWNSVAWFREIHYYPVSPRNVFPKLSGIKLSVFPVFHPFTLVQHTGTCMFQILVAVSLQIKQFLAGSFQWSL